MADSEFLQILHVGSFLIAVVIGAAFGYLVSRAARLNPSPSLLPRLLAAAATSTALQWFWWSAVADGTTTIGGRTYPSGIGISELIRTLTDNTAFLAAAFWLVRRAAKAGSSAKQLSIFGALGAPVGFAAGALLSTVLGVSVFLGCVGSFLSCRT